MSNLPMLLHVFLCVVIFIVVGVFSFRSFGLNAGTPNPSQFTIFYNGSICIFDGIPAEKVSP